MLMQIEYKVSRIQMKKSYFMVEVSWKKQQPGFLQETEVPLNG